MEPQIGIRGRGGQEGPRGVCFNGAPDRNPGKGLLPQGMCRSGSFNGAPDRNPGKADSSHRGLCAVRGVSMEPQIGIYPLITSSLLDRSWTTGAM